jgi:hypothetical protein
MGAPVYGVNLAQLRQIFDILPRCEDPFAPQTLGFFSCFGPDVSRQTSRRALLDHACGSPRVNHLCSKQIDTAWSIEEMTLGHVVCPDAIWGCLSDATTVLGGDVTATLRSRLAIWLAVGGSTDSHHLPGKIVRRDRIFTTLSLPRISPLHEGPCPVYPYGPVDNSFRAALLSTIVLI